MITRSGYGELAFSDVRGPDFPLDSPEAAGATILVAGTNFGCGSSREHAVWALQQAGYKCVIGKKTAETPGFSDIFRQNSANCGLLLIELEEADHARLVAAGSGAEVEVDLLAQTVNLDGSVFRFEINPTVKDAIVKGLDLIGTTLEFEKAIMRFETESPAFVPKRERVA